MMNMLSENSSFMESHKNSGDFDQAFIRRTLTSLREDLEISYVDKRAQEQLHQHDLLGIYIKNNSLVTDELNDVYGELIKKENVCKEMLDLSGKQENKTYTSTL